MNGYDAWFQGWQAQAMSELQAAIEQSRLEWVGRRVWCAGNTYQGYACVMGIDSRGMVGLRFEGAPHDPGCVMRLEALGLAITHAD